MLAAASYKQILQDLSRYDSRSGLRIAGIVFARPETPLAREEIFPSIGYYHFRSGPATNFYFAGFDEYTGNAPSSLIVSDAESGIRWGYSARSFNELRRELERHTRWVYSGGCDLLVMGVSFTQSTGTARLDFSSAIDCSPRRDAGGQYLAASRRVL